MQAQNPGPVLVSEQFIWVKQTRTREVLSSCQYRALCRVCTAAPWSAPLLAACRQQKPFTEGMGGLELRVIVLNINEPPCLVDLVGRVFSSVAVPVAALGQALWPVVSDCLHWCQGSALPG